MNPQASTFVPSVVANPLNAQKYQMHILLSHIKALKKEQFQENYKLHVLHNQMQRQYQVLCVESQRTNNNEDGCMKKADVLEMMDDYKARSAGYKKQNSKLNDISASVMTLEQRYNKLAMTLAATASSPTAPVSRTNARKRLLDGIQRRYKYQKPSTTLLVIMENESEDDSFEWDECSGVDVNEDGADGHKDIRSLSIGSDESSEAKESEMQYEEDLETLTGSEITYDDIGSETSSCTLAPCYVTDGDDTFFNAPIGASVDVDRVKIEMADILRMVTYHRSEAIENKLDQLLRERADSVAVVAAATRCIIDAAVDSKPRLATLCAKKYSALCWSVLNYCESVCCDRFRAKDVCPHSLEEIKNLDFEQLLNQQLYDTFCDLQKGADPDKFVNICILMAELYNGNLLHCSMILKVFRSILRERTISRVCKSDIDALHEIFKRSSVSLRKASAFQRQQIEHYVKELCNLKNRPKFNTKPYQKSLYLIDQIHRHFYR